MRHRRHYNSSRPPINLIDAFHRIRQLMYSVIMSVRADLLDYNLTRRFETDIFKI